MNYCPNCGTANRDGSRFCNECGHKLPSKTGIICPMCSHINPTQNVYCDNCQARLVPMTPAAPDKPQPAASAPPIKKGLSLPTKLADESASDEAAPTETPEETEPDWLLKLRAAAPKASELKESVESPPPAGELPDWMRPASGEEPDWFKRISEPAAAAQPAESPPPSADEALPDWLLDLETSPAPPSPAPAASPVEAASPSEAPDWLHDLQTKPAAQPEEDVPDWLRQLETPAPAETTPAPETESPQPDWLGDLRVEPAAPESDVPGWMQTPETPAVTQPPAPIESEPDMPDWLAALQGAPPAAQAEPEPTAEPSEEPDWLAGLRATSEATSNAAEPDWLAALGDTSAPAAGAESTEPDWLGRILTPADESATASVSQEPASPEEEAPDWLRDVQVAPAPAAQTDEVPDWLREFRPEQPAEAAPPAVEEPVAAFIDGGPEAETPVETPDWLSGIEQTPAPAPASIEPAQPAELPNWLRDLGPLPAGASQPEKTPFGETAPAAAGEMPAWLKEMRPGAAAPAFADESGRPLDVAATDSGLAAAAIPSWLQALRPTETAAAPAAEAVVESEGLLAGLSNVIPAMSLMGAIQGAPAATRIEAPAADIARAGLFQELLARGALEPTVVQPGLGRKGRMRDRVARWIIAAVLIVAAFVPSFSDIVSSVFKLRDIADALALFGDAQSQIEALASGDRALLVFDYDVFQAVEMEPIARAFLTHLQQKGAIVTAASLNPFGVSIADQVRAKMERDGLSPPDFERNSYYAGQATGAQQALADAQAKLVVVLTASPESLRWWVEQNAALTGQRIIVAGLSAGALPQAQPYVQSGQIKAVVAGLIGGLAYQRALDPEPDRGNVGQERTIRAEALYLSQIVFALVLIAGMIFAVLGRGSRQANG